MYGEMLCASEVLVVFRPLRTLQSTHHGESHPCGQIRVFTVSLLSASPSRVAEDIDIRRPYRVATIAGKRIVLPRYGVLGT